MILNIYQQIYRNIQMKGFSKMHTPKKFYPYLNQIDTTEKISWHLLCFQTSL